MRKTSESEDNSIGAILYQGKPLSQWEKEFEGEFTAKQLLQLIRSGVDLGRIQLGLVDEDGSFDDSAFKGEKFADEVFEAKCRATDEATDEEAALDEAKDSPEDVVTVEDFISMLKAHAQPNDKLLFRVNKQEHSLFDTHSKGGVTVIDFVKGKYMNEGITPAQWQEASDWFNSNGYEVEDDEVRLEQFGPQIDQFLFKAGMSPTGKDEVVSGDKAYELYKSMKQNMLNEDVELSVDSLAEEFMTVADLRDIGQKSYPHNKDGWLLDNIVGIVNGKVIDFSKIEYARPEGYPSNGTFFLLDGTQASLDAYEKEKALMLNENDTVKKANESEDGSIFSVADLIDELKDSTTSPNLDIVLANVDGSPYYITKVVPKKNSVLLRCREAGAMNEAITYDQWQEAAQWFSSNGYEIEDDEARQEQFAPQGDQFLFKAGQSPTGKDEIVSGTEAYRLYKSLKENEMKSTNEGHSWYGGGYGGTGKPWKSLGGRGPRGAEIGWYAVADLDPKAKGKMPGWRCGPSNFPFKDTFFPNRKYKVGTMVMRNKYVNAGPFSGEMYIAVPSYFEIVKSGNKEGIDVLNVLGIPLDLTFGMDPNDDYSVTYIEK